MTPALTQLKGRLLGSLFLGGLLLAAEGAGRR